MYGIWHQGKCSPGEPPTRAPFRSSMLCYRRGAALCCAQVYQIGLHCTRPVQYNRLPNNDKMTYKNRMEREYQLTPASYTGKRRKQPICVPDREHSRRRKLYTEVLTYDCND